MTNTVPVILVDDEGSDKSKVIHKARVIDFGDCKEQDDCAQICQGYFCYKLLCGKIPLWKLYAEKLYIPLDAPELALKLAAGYSFCKRCERSEG